MLPNLFKVEGLDWWHIQSLPVQLFIWFSREFHIEGSQTGLCSCSAMLALAKRKEETTTIANTKCCLIFPNVKKLIDDRYKALPCSDPSDFPLNCTSKAVRITIDSVHAWKKTEETATIVKHKTFPTPSTCEEIDWWQAQNFTVQWSIWFSRGVHIKGTQDKHREYSRLKKKGRNSYNCEHKTFPNLFKCREIYWWHITRVSVQWFIWINLQLHIKRQSGPHSVPLQHQSDAWTSNSPLLGDFFRLLRVKRVLAFDPPAKGKECAPCQDGGTPGVRVPPAVQAHGVIPLRPQRDGIWILCVRRVHGGRKLVLLVLCVYTRRRRRRGREESSRQKRCWRHLARRGGYLTRAVNRVQ